MPRSRTYGAGRRVASKRNRRSAIHRGVRVLTPPSSPHHSLQLVITTTHVGAPKRPAAFQRKRDRRKPTLRGCQRQIAPLPRRARTIAHQTRMHSATPTLLQTLRRAASLLASRPHLLQQQPEWAAAAASAAQQRSAASASANAPPSSSSKTPTPTTTTTLPPHIDQAYLAAARARVFDHALQSDGVGAAAAGRRSGRKPLLAPLRGRELNSWYVTAEREAPPLLENDEESERIERVALAKSSGRAPPKKGQGKRSGGKKKK
jgi:hypothetical protein